MTVFSSLAVCVAPNLLADWLPTSGTNVWQTTTNWLGNTIDGKFNQTSTADQFVNLTGSTSASSLNFIYDGAFNMTVQSSTGTSRTLTLTNGITLDSVSDGRLVSIGASGAGVRVALNNSIQDFNVAGTDELVIFNSITNATAGDGGINKKGTGTLRMEGTSGSYSLGTVVTAGTLAIGANSALGSGAVTMNGGRLVASGTSRIIANNLVVGADFTTGGTGYFALTINGTTDLGSALRTISFGNTTTFGGAISGTGGLTLNTVSAARTVTFATANTYSGTTTIDGAVTLALTGTANLHDTSTVNLVSSTAELNISGITATSETIGSLAGVTSASVVLGNRNLTVGGDNTSTSFAGTISGTGGSITKIGSSTFSLPGDSTYTGGTSILAGTLSVNSGTSMGAAPVSATPGYLTINGGTLATTATFTLSTNRGIALGPNSGSGGGTISPTGSSTLTYGGVIANNGSGTGSLTVGDTGTLVLTGTNTYTGGTTVNGGGSLQVGNNGAGTTGPGVLTVATGSTIFGSGTVRGSAATTHSIAGTMRPGDRPSGTTPLANLNVEGYLVFTPVSSSFFEIGNPASAYDKITGTVGGTSITLDGTIKVDFSSYTPVAGDLWNLLSWSTIIGSSFNPGAGLRSGANGADEGDFDLPDLTTLSLQWNVGSFLSNGTISVQAIPEPTRCLMAAMGFVAIALRQRRR